MIDRHRLREHRAVFPRAGDCLCQLVGVQRDGFLAENMLAGGERRQEIVDVRVVRGGDVDNVHIGIIEYILHPRIDLRDRVLRGKCLGLFLRSVGDGIQSSPQPAHRLCELMSDHTAAQRRPAIFHLCHKNPPSGALARKIRRAQRSSSASSSMRDAWKSCVPLRPASAARSISARMS